MAVVQLLEKAGKKMTATPVCAYFSVYHKKSVIYANEWVYPIQTGFLQHNVDLGFLKDSDGINISSKNKNFAELTAHYWVWKNYFPSFNGKYIGFCHYRRFLSLNCNVIDQYKTNPVQILYSNFSKLFDKNYAIDAFIDFCGDCDVIVPQKTVFKNQSVLSQYISQHPKRDLDACFSVICKKYPDYIPFCDAFFKGNSGYFCLNFIMKKELFDNWCKWIFDILNDLEKQSDYSMYNSYATIRTPAYLAERLFNVWLMYQIEKKSLKIRESPLYLLCEETDISYKKKIFPGIRFIRKGIFRTLRIFGIKIPFPKVNVIPR